MTDVHLPLNLNIESFRGERYASPAIPIPTVRTMLKVSSIDGNMKLILDIDANRGTVKFYTA